MSGVSVPCVVDDPIDGWTIDDLEGALGVVSVETGLKTYQDVMARLILPLLFWPVFGSSRALALLAVPQVTCALFGSPL